VRIHKKGKSITSSHAIATYLDLQSLEVVHVSHELAKNVILLDCMQGMGIIKLHLMVNKNKTITTNRTNQPTNKTNQSINQPTNHKKKQTNKQLTNPPNKETHQLYEPSGALSRVLSHAFDGVGAVLLAVRQSDRNAAHNRLSRLKVRMEKRVKTI
jgi:hypothetical protein